MIESDLAEVLEQAAAVAEADAFEFDKAGRFPRRGVAGLAEGGPIARITARDGGGRGEGMRAAAVVTERLARSCASIAVVTMMHYSAVAVIEAHGPGEVRRAIGAGRHLTT